MLFYFFDVFIINGFLSKSYPYRIQIFLFLVICHRYFLLPVWFPICFAIGLSYPILDCTRFASQNWNYIINSTDTKKYSVVSNSGIGTCFEIKKE